MKSNDKIKAITSPPPSNWKEKVAFRIKNRWLEYSSQIARRILAAIEDNEDLNQAKLAKALDVKPQQISKIVQGQENLTLESIYKISKALGVELIRFPDYKYTEQLKLQEVGKTHKRYLPFESTGGTVTLRNDTLNSFEKNVA